MLGIYPMGAVVILATARLRGLPSQQRRPAAPARQGAGRSAGRWLETPDVLDLRLVDPLTGAATTAIKDCVPAADAGVDDVWQYL